MSAAQAHLCYLQRDGVGRGGERGRLYSAVEDDADGKAFLARSDGDRHQFRMIATADDGAQYHDLCPVVRRFMAQVEKDFGTSLDWVAVNHADTGRPHTHIVLRGREESGEDLVISPAYINRGMSVRLAELVSIDLGPKSDFEIRRLIHVDVEAERLTAIDRKLVHAANTDHIVTVSGQDPFDHSMQVRRLRKLETLGLAEHVRGGQWRLSEDLEQVLRGIGDRADRFRTMQRALSDAGVKRAFSEQAIFDPVNSRAVTGRIVSSGSIDDERKYLVVDGTDGRCHFVEIAADEAVESFSSGAIVRVSPGSKVAEVELLSPLPLEQLAGHDGATWLDRELLSPVDMQRDAHFGREVRSALAARRSWLIERGFASVSGGRVAYAPAIIEQLRRRELAQLCDAITQETGLRFESTPEGVPIKGIVRRRLDLASGRFVMIEDGSRFSLVPWPPVPGHGLGQSNQVDVAISWTMGNQRRLEI